MTHDLGIPDADRLEYEARLENTLLRLGADKPAGVSANTHNAYLRVCRQGLRLVPGVWGHEASPKTRCYNRAAFRYWARTKLCDLQDVLARRKPRFGTVASERFEGPGVVRLVYEIEVHLSAIKKHLAEFERKDIVFPPKPASKSKRRGLSTLPHAWRERLWDGVPNNAEYRDEIAVMSVIGVRPIELTLGIRVRLAKDDRTLIFFVHGAKVTEAQGQPIRVIRSICARPEAEHLRAKCRQAKGTVLIQAKCSPKRLYDSVSNYGSAAFPEHAYRIAPYSFRHQLGADLKTENTGREQIAAVLGHITTRTASNYGRKVWGSGQRQPSAALISGVAGAKVFREITIAKPRHPGAKNGHAGTAQKST